MNDQAKENLHSHRTLLETRQRMRRFTYTALGLGIVIMLGVGLMQIAGSAQQEQAFRDVALQGESITVVQSTLEGAQSAIVSCIDLASQPPISSSAAVVVPAAMNPSIAHEAVAVNRLNQIMFTLSVKNVSSAFSAEAGVRLTLVNRLSVPLTCDVQFLQ